MKNYLKFGLFALLLANFLSIEAQGPLNKFLTPLGLNQLPDCTRFGAGDYTWIQHVPAGAASLQNLPRYDCAAITAAVTLTGMSPTVLTIPPPATVAIGFIYGEVPAGAIDGANKAFTLLNMPNPAASVQVFRNLGVAVAGVDYTVAGNAITFAVAPLVGDGLIVNYRTQ